MPHLLGVPCTQKTAAEAVRQRGGKKRPVTDTRSSASGSACNPAPPKDPNRPSQSSAWLLLWWVSAAAHGAVRARGRRVHVGQRS